MLSFIIIIIIVDVIAYLFSDSLNHWIPSIPLGSSTKTKGEERSLSQSSGRDKTDTLDDSEKLPENNRDSFGSVESDLSDSLRKHRVSCSYDDD